MKALLCVVAATAALMSTSALAQDAGPNLYGSVGYSNIGAEDLNMGAITARLGAQFTPNLGIEGEGSFGITEDTIAYDAGPPLGVIDIDFKVSHDIALYAVGFVPMNENFELLARLGYGTTTLEGESMGFSADEDGASWRLGAGGQFFMDGVNGFRAEYTRMDGDEIEADVFTISYVRRFR